MLDVTVGSTSDSLLFFDDEVLVVDVVAAVRFSDPVLRLDGADGDSGLVAPEVSFLPLFRLRLLT